MSVAVSMGGTPENPADALLDDYVDRLGAPLTGVIPLERRRRFLSEVATHLEALAEDFRAEGLEPDEAARKAIREHGNPGRLAEAFASAWYERGARGPLERRFGRANCTAFGAFVVFHALYLLALQARVLEPGGDYSAPPLDLDPLRSLGPLLVYSFVAPTLAGCWTGWKVPARAGISAYHALAPLILCSFAVGVCLLPVTEGVLFALLQFAIWLPVGVLSAHVASVVARAARAARTPG